MRTNPSYHLLPALLIVATLLTPSCEPADPIIEELPATATITLDVSDPNTHAGNTGGYRYLYEGESYSATYNAWATWTCEAGPNFFAAWDDTSLTIWLAHCPVTLHLESITAQTGDGESLPIESWSPVAGAHESTYQLTLTTSNYIDIENGATTINLRFSYQNQ